MALSDKFNRKQVDPTAIGKGKAGVLPHIPDVERALSTLDDEVFKQIEYEYHHGREKGQSTHNKYLDPFFKWMPGYTNVITGWPGHGKSRMFFELLLLRAVFEGKKSAIWPSENLPPKTFYQDLIHTLTGRPADKSQANHLSPAEMKRATDFLREHIILLNPPPGMPYTPAHMLAMCEAAVAKYGVEHCMLDPWNKQDHSAKNKLGGDEGYLVHSLGLCTKWSMDTRQCLVVTAHPKRLAENMQFGTTRPVPDGAAISGGQTWENMPHFVGAVHRPFKHITGNLEAAFYAHKSKDELNVARLGTVGGYGFDGAPPMVPVAWDPISLRYRWGRERWSPLDDELARAVYAPPTAAPAPQLFTPQASPPAPPPLPASTFEAEGSATEEYPAEAFGPRQINSASLPPRP
jgi:hypothetical protein